MPPQDPVRPRLGEHALAALAALAFGALALAYMRPSWRLLGTHIAPDPGDPLFLVYILKWDVHRLHQGLAGLGPGLWDPPFFYPTRGVLTYSDHMLGPALVCALLGALGVGILAAFNVLFLTSYAASGWSAWWVLRKSGLGPAPAFFGGIAFGFSCFRWSESNHLQVLLTAALPLVLWSWDRLLADPRPRRAAAFVALYLVHLSGGTYLAYMIHVPLAILAANRAPELWRRDRLRGALRVAAPAALLCALAALGLFLPYLRAARHGTLARTEREFQIYGASLVSYASPAAENLYSRLFPARWRRPESDLFPGFLPTALAALGIAGALRRRHRPARRRLTLPGRALLAALAATALAGWAIGDWKTLHGARLIARAAPLGHRVRYEEPLLLALGAIVLFLLLRRAMGGNWPLDLAGMDPWARGLAVSGLACFLLSFPTAYQPLARILPGLGSMRVPSRFYPFVSFALCYFAARALHQMAGRTTLRRGAALAWGAVALLAVEVTPRPLPWVPVPGEESFPPVYSWLAGRGDVRALLEVPLEGETQEIAYMYFGTRHWKPLVNGYSGHFPPAWEALRQTCCAPLPDGPALDQLRRWGVTHVVVHRGRLGGWPQATLRQWEAESPVRLEYAVRGDRVYRLIRGPAREANWPPAGGGARCGRCSQLALRAQTGCAPSSRRPPAAGYRRGTAAGRST